MSATKQAREQIAATLAGVELDGLEVPVYADPPAQPFVPCILIVPADDYLTTTALSGRFSVKLDAVCLVPAVSADVDLDRLEVLAEHVLSKYASTGTVGAPEALVLATDSDEGLPVVGITVPLFAVYTIETE